MTSLVTMLKEGVKEKLPNGCIVVPGLPPDVSEVAAVDRAAAAQPPQPVPDAVQLLARGLHEEAAAHLRAEVRHPCSKAR